MQCTLVGSGRSRQPLSPSYSVSIKNLKSLDNFYTYWPKSIKARISFYDPGEKCPSWNPGPTLLPHIPLERIVILLVQFVLAQALEIVIRDLQSLRTLHLRFPAQDLPCQ